MKVINMGPTENGNPFLMVIITSPRTWRTSTHQAEQPARSCIRGDTPEAEIKKLVAKARSSSCSPCPCTPPRSAARRWPRARLRHAHPHRRRRPAHPRQRRLIEVPCFNPDGEIMVTDWYNKTLGTPYEGSNYPSLYAKYIGHDNNRDAF
jgi:hypothetical protein